MPRVGFEPTIPVFERAKTVHASDRATTVIGIRSIYYRNIETSDRYLNIHNPCFGRVLIIFKPCTLLISVRVFNAFIFVLRPQLEFE
jgi:hypothetical protein